MSATREPTKEELDFLVRWGGELISSTDIDPQYPMLRELAAMRGLDRQGAHWQTVVFMAYCHFPSMMAALRDAPSITQIGLAVNDYPTNLARRGLRGGRVWKHLMSVQDAVRPRLFDIEDWATRGWRSDPIANYEVFWKRSQTVWGNGRYLAFKWCEMLKKVHHLQLAAPDMRLEHCSGPKEGLCRLYGLPEDTDVTTLNAWALDLRVKLDRAGLRIADWEELETVLCEYNKFVQGRYYVGHDIDEAQEHIEAALQFGWLRPAEAALLYEARRRALPNQYLGELNGWVGIRTDKMGKW